MSELFIDIKNAVFGYVHKGAYKEVVRVESLQLSTARFYALVGNNGSGKSTFLRSISGLQPLLEGSIYIGGISIDAIEKQKLAEMMAVVLTNRVGGFNLLVKDAIQSARMPFTNWYHKLADADLQAIEVAINTVDINGYLNTPLHELSDGMFQKTMIARALAQNSTAIALDEPSAYLDYASKHRLFMLLQQLSANQLKCILATTHDLDLALRYSQELLLIEKGSIRPIAVSEAKADAGFRELSGNFL